MTVDAADRITGRRVARAADAGDYVAPALYRLRARPVLVRAALAGYITTLECAIPECLCPRGRGHFDAKNGTDGHGRWVRHGNTFGPWIPSADRFPLPGRNGGQYAPDNVRLVHSLCNKSDGGKVGGRIRAASMTWDDHSRAGKIGIQKMPAEARARGGRNRSHEASVRAGHIGMCARWHVGRGQDCSCGRHPAGGET